MDNSAWHSPKREPSYDSGVYRDRYGMFTSAKKMTSRTYLPKTYNRSGILISHLEYVEKMRNRDYRVVSDTFVDPGGVFVLTTWEGRHPPGLPLVAGDKPLIFKTTMFLADDTDDTMYLVYSTTEEDAQRAHARAVVFAENIRLSDDKDENEGEDE